MALASASERIRLMEESLGAPLLERHRRGVRATPAGAALVHHAQLVTQQLERMRGELSEYADGFSPLRTDSLPVVSKNLLARKRG